MILAELELPVRVESLNRQLALHWSKGSRARKRQHEVVRMAMWRRCEPIRHRQTPGPWGGPFVVTLTRLGVRTLDGDNLQGAFKATRDGVAEAMGVDDGDEARVSWEYAQEKAARYGIRITIEKRESP
jgi:hypothetical protein